MFSWEGGRNRTTGGEETWRLKVGVRVLNLRRHFVNMLLFPQGHRIDEIPQTVQLYHR